MRPTWFTRWLVLALLLALAGAVGWACYRLIPLPYQP